MTRTEKAMILPTTPRTPIAIRMQQTQVVKKVMIALTALID